MIAHDGAEATEKWLRGVKANLARKAAGGDRDVARDILAGICDIGVANAYYVGRMKNAEPGTDARKWGDAVGVIRPTFANAKERRHARERQRRRRGPPTPQQGQRRQTAGVPGFRNPPRRCTPRPTMSIPSARA